MTLRIGWYVHHHGGGHVARLLAIAPRIDAQIDCFSSLPRPDALPSHCSWTVLARDDDDPSGAPPPHEADPGAGGLLHWAPLGHPGHLDRLSRIVAAIARGRVDAFVVDVSVEVVLLVRLLGIRPVVIAQPGIRDDEPHRLAYRAAATIVAPWPRALLDPPWLTAVARKVVFTGGISRFEDRMTPAGRGAPRQGVLVLGGRGGTSVTDADVAAAERASGAAWRVLGATPDSPWRADPWDELTSARVVVAWAGQNSIADLAAADASAVIVPQERPFAEQHETARALARAGLAVVEEQWPSPERWPDVLERAERLRPDWSNWQVAGAAARAAEAVTATARAS